MGDHGRTVLMVVCCLAASNVQAVTQTCNMKHKPDLDDKTTMSWLFRDLHLRNASSILSCASRCFQDTSCVTFMYSDKLQQCRMHAARITSYNVLLDAPGFRAFDTCRSDAVPGADCRTDTDCKMVGSVCVSLICQCGYGWSYSPNDLVCVRACSKYGPEFTYFRQALTNPLNIQTLTEPQYLSLAGCQAACLQWTRFVCKSVYLNTKSRSCTLAEITPSLDLLGGLLSTKVDYYQRQCQYV